MKCFLIGFLILISNFSFAQVSVDKESIKGKWVNVSSSNWKWEFKDDGKCYNYLDGIPINGYPIDSIIQVFGEPDSVISRKRFENNIGNDEEKYDTSVIVFLGKDEIVFDTSGLYFRFKDEKLITFGYYVRRI